jgi:hypothetical protein
MSQVLVVYESFQFILTYKDETTMDVVGHIANKLMPLQHYVIRYKNNNITNLGEKMHKIVNDIGPIYLFKCEYLGEDYKHEETIQIIVKFLGIDTQVEVKCNEKDVIGRIKALVLLNTGISLSDQIITLDGVVLEDDKSLKYYSIDNNDVITLTPKGPRLIPEVDLTDIDHSPALVELSVNSVNSVNTNVL